MEQKTFKDLSDIPITFGPSTLAVILGISRNNAYELTKRPDFPKMCYGRRIIIYKPEFTLWMNNQLSSSIESTL